MQRLRPKLSFANVTSVIALIVALGGSAYAAGKINSADIKNNSIKNKDVKRDTLRGDRIDESTLNLTGLDRCPSSAPSAIRGICYTGIVGNAIWNAAALDCAARGLRMPDIGEALLVISNSSFTSIWAADIPDLDAGSSRTVVQRSPGGIVVGSYAATTPNPYICVADATN